MSSSLTSPASTNQHINVNCSLKIQEVSIMSVVFAFILGAIVGGSGGVFVMALMTAAKDGT